MCGEHQLVIVPYTKAKGSSPHVRGAQAREVEAARLEGIIPACAGSTRSVSSTSNRTRDHPRMCGEHSLDATVRVEAEGSSPHVRGALRFL